MSPSYMRLAIIKRIATSTKTRILTFHPTLLLSESDWTNWLWVLGRQFRSAINGGAIAVDDVHFNICSSIRPRWRPLTFRAGKQTALSVGRSLPPSDAVKIYSAFRCLAPALCRVPHWRCERVYLFRVYFSQYKLHNVTCWKSASQIERKNL